MRLQSDIAKEYMAVSTLEAIRKELKVHKHDKIFSKSLINIARKTYEALDSENDEVRKKLKELQEMLP